MKRKIRGNKSYFDSKYKYRQLIRETFSFNLSRNIVALQVEKRCCPYYQRDLPRNKFQCCKLKKLSVAKVELGSTLRNILLQLATLKFVAWQVEHGAVIRATTCSTFNAATMLCYKLNENVSRIILPLIRKSYHGRIGSQVPYLQ